MSGSPKVDTAVLASSSIIAADQIMQAVRDHREDHPKDATPHYVKAVIAGAIAVGAYQMLMRDEDKNVYDEQDDSARDSGLDEGHEHHKHHRHHERRSSHDSSHSDQGHGRDLLGEALGAYALGRQMMGHKEHPILKLVAEGLGAAGFAREAGKDLL